MNSNLQKGRTLNSFLAAKQSEIRKKQIADLDFYVEERRKRKKKTLRFIKYWGASNKTSVDKYDLESLIFVFGFLRSIEKQYEMDAHLTLIFTDTHVTLNGYLVDCYESYYKDIRQNLNIFNYNHFLMSEIINPFIRLHHRNNMNDFIDSIIQKSLKYDIPRFLNGRDSFEKLSKSASKHSVRYYDKHLFRDLRFDSSNQAAYAYIKLNQIEREYVEKRFPQSVFLTYTSDEEQELISPDLPTLQIYSYQKGMRSRPWFSYFDKSENKTRCVESQQ